MQKKVNNPNTIPIKVDTVKYKIRASIDNFYDMQKLRIQCGNRICAAIRQTDDETENDNILKTLASEYNRVTDVLAEKYKSSRRSLGKAIKATDDLEIIKSEIDYNMAEQYVALLNQEQQISKFISKLVKEHPMWDRFFGSVDGCGPLMAAVCISYLDIHKARYVSSFWSYAGVGTRAADDPDAPRVAMSRKALVDAVYLDKDGNVQMRKSIGYNDFLHTKLLGVLGDSFVKRSGSEYRKVYDDYKNRYQNRADWKNDKGEVSAMRCHRAAIRQAIKAFLRDLWVEWRTYEGYTIPESYAEAHLGMAPHGYNEAGMRPVE